MTSATTPAASPGPYASRHGRLRRAVVTAALAGCCATVGCKSAGGPLALLKRDSQTAGAVSMDPFNAAETALASNAGAKKQGGEGRVSLGGAVRTASLDGARTSARPAGVTRVDPTVPPRPSSSRWQAGEGSDAEAGAAKVRLAGGAFAASDAPKPSSAKTAAAQTPAAPNPAVKTPAVAKTPAATPQPAAKAPAAKTDDADIDWGAEMASFAEEAAKAAAESSTPTDSPKTLEKESMKAAVASTAAADATGSAEPVETVDRESLSSAPLWNAPATTAPAEPVAAEPEEATSENDGWRSRKTGETTVQAKEEAEAIDPFAGL